MVIHYFKQKKKQESDKAYKVYERIIFFCNQFVKSNDLIISKNFNSKFEIFSLFLIFFLKCNIELNLKNYKNLNQNLINLFIKDLDNSLREEGIGDMSIGKYVKKYVKKFYYRLDNVDKHFNEFNIDNFSIYIQNLNFVKKDHSLEFSKKIYEKFTDIQLEIKTNI
tara:strand:+ start:310 stop:807 length:498 start_codon:yes stop_codon:yes gene_type:complete